MDTMALLCTLHGDGPATLKTLRRSGLTSLDAVAKEDAERLSTLLGIPTAAARRLQKEAILLDDRCGVREDEEEAPPNHLGMPTGLSQIAVRPVDTHSMDISPVVTPKGDAETLDARDRALVRRVMAQMETGSHATFVTVPEASTEVESAHAKPLSEDQVTQSPQPSLPRGLELVPGRLESLDGDLCRRMYEAGVHTLTDLSDANPLSLSRELGLGFSRVRRLQFLARRAGDMIPAREEGSVATAVESVPRPATEATQPRVRLPRFSAADRPQDPTTPIVILDKISSEGAGGPFAE
jgi:hypothetical protein